MELTSIAISSRVIGNRVSFDHPGTGTLIFEVSETDPEEGGLFTEYSRKEGINFDLATEEESEYIPEIANIRYWFRVRLDEVGSDPVYSNTDFNWVRRIVCYRSEIIHGENQVIHPGGIPEYYLRFDRDDGSGVVSSEYSRISYSVFRKRSRLGNISLIPLSGQSDIEIPTETALSPSTGNNIDRDGDRDNIVGVGYNFYFGVRGKNDSLLFMNIGRYLIRLTCEFTNGSTLTTDLNVICEDPFL